MSKDLDIVLNSVLSTSNSIESNVNFYVKNTKVLVTPIVGFSAIPVALTSMTGSPEWLFLLIVTVIGGLAYAAGIGDAWNSARRVSKMLKKKGIKLSLKEKIRISSQFNRESNYDFTYEHVSEHGNILIESEAQGDLHNIKIDIERADENSFDEIFHDALTVQNQSTVTDFDENNAKLMSNVTVFQKNVHGQLLKMNNQLTKISQKEGQVPYGLETEGNGVRVVFRHSESKKAFADLKQTCADDLEERLKANN